MDLIILCILALLPIIVIFTGLVFLKLGGTLMAVIGWVLTGLIAVLFFHTSPEIALDSAGGRISGNFRALPQSGPGFWQKFSPGFDPPVLPFQFDKRA